MLFNRKNTNQASNENESIINQDISSKHAKSPQQRAEGMKPGEPQSFGDFTKIQNQENIYDQRPETAEEQRIAATPRSKETGREA